MSSAIELGDLRPTPGLRPKFERPTLLEEQAIREASKQRAWIVLSALSVGIGIVFLYFLIIGVCRETVIAIAVKRFGPSAAEFTPLMLILVAFPLFLGPTLTGAHRAARIGTSCPLCDADLSSQVDQLIATRCCPTCGKHAVRGGTVRSEAAYERLRAIRSRAFLKHWNGKNCADSGDISAPEVFEFIGDV